MPPASAYFRASKITPSNASTVSALAVLTFLPARTKILLLRRLSALSLLYLEVSPSTDQPILDLRICPGVQDALSTWEKDGAFKYLFREFLV